MEGQYKISVMVAVVTYYQAPFLSFFGGTMERKNEYSESGEKNINKWLHKIVSTRAPL